MRLTESSSRVWVLLNVGVAAVKLSQAESSSFHGMIPLCTPTINPYMLKVNLVTFVLKGG